MKSGRPRGPGKAHKNVGGFAPHIFARLSRAPGAGQASKTHLTKSGQTAFRDPAYVKFAAQRRPGKVNLRTLLRSPAAGPPGLQHGEAAN